MTSPFGFAPLFNLRSTCGWSEHWGLGGLSLWGFHLLGWSTQVDGTAFWKCTSTVSLHPFSTLCKKKARWWSSNGAFLCDVSLRVYYSLKFTKELSMAVCVFCNDLFFHFLGERIPKCGGVLWVDYDDEGLALLCLLVNGIFILLVARLVTQNRDFPTANTSFEDRLSFCCSENEPGANHFLLSAKKSCFGTCLKDLIMTEALQRDNLLFVGVQPRRACQPLLEDM